MRDVVNIEAERTPIGKRNGGLGTATLIERLD